MIQKSIIIVCVLNFLSIFNTNNLIQQNYSVSTIHKIPSGMDNISGVYQGKLLIGNIGQDYIQEVEKVFIYLSDDKPIISFSGILIDNLILKNDKILFGENSRGNFPAFLREIRFDRQTKKIKAVFEDDFEDEIIFTLDKIGESNDAKLDRKSTRLNSSH